MEKWLQSCHCSILSLVHDCNFGGLREEKSMGNSKAGRKTTKHPAVTNGYRSNGGRMEFVADLFTYNAGGHSNNTTSVLD